MTEILLVGLFVWLLVLTGVTYLESRFIRRLTRGAQEKDLIKVLKRIVEKEELNSRDLERFKKELVRIEEEGLGHIQKIGLVRFNPFRETGGDHSFSLAVLDGNNTGFIITGLHTRERTRLYLKEIKKGKGDSELSGEEIKAFEKAQKMSV